MSRRRRRSSAPRRRTPTLPPAALFDSWRLGVREAERGVPKTGSVAWVEAGRDPGDWFNYSRGYDGVPVAAFESPRSCLNETAPYEALVGIAASAVAPLEVLAATRITPA